MTQILKNIILLFATLYLLIGCFGLFDSGSDKIIGRYIVLWIDLPQNQMLSKQDELHSSGSSEIIPAYIFAVGHDNNYIIAKQHPTNGEEGGYKIHPDTTNFYIIDITNNIDKTFGPLTLFQFDSLRIKLGIQNLKFDKTYPDNP